MMKELQVGELRDIVIGYTLSSLVVLSWGTFAIKMKHYLKVASKFLNSSLLI